MTRDEFQAHFDHVSESHKRDTGERTKKGRAKIGRIGIGFIAANELCDVMELTSTKRGSTDLLKVEIDFRKMRDASIEERREGRREMAKGDYSGSIGQVPREAHYTRIFLREVRKHAREVLAGARPGAHMAGEQSLYGLPPESIARRLADPKLRTWADLNLYSQTMLRVGLNVPVRYPDGWLPRPLVRQAREFQDEVASQDFTVMWDGTDLRKPIILGHNSERHMLRRFEYQGENVSARGYFFAKHGTLRPQELNGLLIRIRNAAVGEYDSSFLGFRSSDNTLFQRWISAEIWADDRLEEALNIDRRTLRETHPAYVELQAAVHERFSEVLREARDQLHAAPSAAKKAARAAEQLQRIDEIATEHRVSLPAPVMTKIEQGADEVIAVKPPRSAFANYSVSEVFGLALRVAEEELPRPLFRKFARALAKRLLG